MRGSPMDWVEKFYSTTGTWWGPAESRISERDYQRLRIMERLCGRGPRRVLELGSSYGATAAVMAQAGHDVVGIELSDRIAFARQYEDHAGDGSLQFVHDDFFQAAFDTLFDVICYWNGFGIGADADQRRLLRRMADEWLEDDGVVLLDVANPVCWITWAGDEESLTAAPEEGYRYDVSERIDFDPVRNRFIDTWWETETPERALSQDIRCYAPPDLLLLLEGTGLQLDLLEVAGQAIDLLARHTSSHPLWTAHEYLARLSKGGPHPPRPTASDKPGES